MPVGTAKRYQMLLERALVDLRLARDAGAHVPCARLSRIERARRELRAELNNFRDREQTTATFTTRDRAALTD